MSYNQAMKWRKKHPKGTKQPVLMSTGSGFWASCSWLDKVFLPYLRLCDEHGIPEDKRMKDEELYNFELRSKYRKGMQVVQYIILKQSKGEDPYDLFK